MIDYMDFGSTRLMGSGQTARQVSRIQGLLGVPGVRGSMYEAPNADGSIEEYYNRLSGRVVTIEGECWGSSIISAHTVFSATCAALYNGGSANTLKFKVEGGTYDVQGSGRLNGEIMSELSASLRGSFIKWQANLRFADPVWYYQTAQSGTTAYVSGPGGPLTVSCTNYGDIAVWPTIVLEGPWAGGAMVIQVEGVDYLVFTATNEVGTGVSSPDVLYCKPGDRAYLKTEDLIPGMEYIDYTNSLGFPSLAAGTSTDITITDASYSATSESIAVSWRSGWLNPV